MTALLASLALAIVAAAPTASTSTSAVSQRHTPAAVMSLDGKLLLRR